jgi:hypothetical protein
VSATVTTPHLPLGAIWGSCSAPVECGISILATLAPYLATYAVVFVSLVFASIVFYQVLDVFIHLNYSLYSKRLRMGSLKTKTRSAQWYYLGSKSIRRLGRLSFIQIGYLPDEFQRLKAGGLPGVTRSLVQLPSLPFRFTASNLFTWSLVLIIERPSLPTVAEARKAVDYAWNADWGKFLPWLALVLLLTAYHRVFKARVRLRYKEKSADRAFELSVSMANALSSIRRATDRNISTLMKDLESGRLLETWCSEVTGYSVWSVSNLQASVRPKPRSLLSNLDYCSYREPKESDIKVVADVIKNMEEERLWPFWRQLWPDITFELRELKLLSIGDPDPFCESLLDTSRIRSLVQADAEACGKRLASEIESAKDDLAGLRSPSWVTNDEHQTRAILELSSELSAELRPFIQLMHRTVGESIYASICIDRVVNSILSYGDSSHMDRALLSFSK